MIGVLTLFTTGVSILLASQPAIADNTPHLLSRQATTFDPSIIPSQCLQTQCTALVQQVQNCTQLSCLCTAAVASDMKACFQCAVNANVASINATSAQTAITGYTDGCKAAGFPISGMSDTSGSSGSSSSSTTGSASASKATTAVGTKSSGTLVGVSIGFLGAVVGLAMAGLSL